MQNDTCLIKVVIVKDYFKWTIYQQHDKSLGFDRMSSFYISLLSRSFSDHHLRCGGWLNLEFSKREKHSGWAIKTIYKK